MGTIELDPRLCHATTFLGRSPKMLIDAQISSARSPSRSNGWRQRPIGESGGPLRVGCQGVFSLRRGIANVLGVDKEKVRVLTGNAGGCSA
jgi:hypothetical protein